MEKKKQGNESLDEKIDVMNEVFDDLILDAKAFSQDIVSGISLNFFMAAVSILFGIQTAWYNRLYIMEGDYIPLLLAAIIILSGVITIIRGLSLRAKYSRLYNIEKEL